MWPSAGVCPSWPDDGSAAGGCCSGSTDGPTRVIALVGLSIFSDTGAVLDAILKAADSSSVSPLVREVKGYRPRQVCLLHDSCGHIVMVVAGQRGVGVVLCLEAALHLPQAGLPRGRRVRGRQGTTRDPWWPISAMVV